MAKLAERVNAEFENVDAVVARVPSESELPNLSDLELAGVAAMVHSFYNGMENILKQVMRERGVDLPKGESWHKELVQLAVSEGILSEQTASAVRAYLAFRHFFSHAYAFDLDPQRLEPLVAQLNHVSERFRHDLNSAIQ